MFLKIEKSPGTSHWKTAADQVAYPFDFIRLNVGTPIFPLHGTGIVLHFKQLEES